MDKIKVLRIIEYVGPRDQVEEQIRNSIHGTRKINEMAIAAVTLHEYPEILNQENREETDTEWLEKRGII